MSAPYGAYNYMDRTMRCRGVIMLLLTLLSPRAGYGGRADIIAALDAPALRGARTAALVVRAQDDAVLFEHHADDRLAPASNQKILTALAVLAAFGPAHRFTTTILADGLVGANGRVGALWVHGGGDPALTSEEWWRLAADLRRGGLRRVDGDIGVDDGAFDAERWNVGWGSATARAYYPAIGALMANYGACTVEIRPGAAGERVRVGLDPPVSYMDVHNEATTVAAGGADTLIVERQAGAANERISIAGTIAADAAPRIVHRSVADPALYAGAVFRLQLAANGIEVAGAVRRNAAPPGARELLRYEGKPLAEIVRLLMKYSNNAIAETLCKALGANDTGQPGSWSTGLASIGRRLGSLGVDLSPFTLVDASGLSAANRVSARGLVAALRVARTTFAFAPEFTAALPIAGADGTLQQRGSGAVTKVRAKTGSLAGAAGLSGYALTADGEEVIFSILVNDYRTSDADVIAAIDRFAAALARAEPRSAAGQLP